MKDKLIVIDNDVKFELYLSDTKITYQEENSKYKDSFSTLFSFPFEFHLDRDLRLLMGDFSSLKAHNLKTLYENCYHIRDGRIRKAKLEILGSKGEVIKAQLDSGFEQFPNWDKKLRDLPLETVSSDTEDMISVANETISKTYPEVNYNFPMVHTDSYKGNQAFEDFEGIINKRENGSFIANEFDAENNIYKNKNIVLPMPYWLYVLKTGFEDAGFSLHGDILENETLKKMMILPTKKLDISKNINSIKWIVGVESRIGDFEEVKSTQPINIYGKFLARGWVRNQPHRKEWVVHLFGGQQRRWKVKPYIKPSISLNDEVIYFPDWNTDKTNFSFEFTTKFGENNLSYHASSWWDDPFLELEIIPLEIYNEDGTPKEVRADLNYVNIQDWLPDKTFGELITTTRNLFNFDFEIKNDTEVWMNYIESIFNEKTIKNISQFEIENPERLFSKELSFTMSYKKIESDNYSFSKVFIDKNGMQTFNFTTNENTKNIEIETLPLPLKYENGITTAHHFSNEDIFYIVIFDGIYQGKNICQDPTDLKLQNMFDLYWKKWLQFRINSNGVKWTFFANKNQWKNIDIGDVLYAYNQKLIIKTITKTSYNSRVYEIEIECDVVRI